LRQLSDEFLECARRRLNTAAATKLEGELRRATSDLYFSLFHAVCGAVVQPIGTDSETPGFRDVFLTLYRMTDHGRLEKHARDAAAKESGFSDVFKQFSRQISAMKNKREQADYDPLAQLNLSTVGSDLQSIETIMDRFWAEEPSTRARFAMFLSIERQ